MIGLLMLAAAARVEVLPLPPEQRHYLESCGGCHGLQGESAKQDMPSLRNRVGYLLCSEEGRDYIVRLPNIAFAKLDDSSLASLLNFMVFGLGGTSVPAPGLNSARPYTAAEVGELRKRPLKGQNLTRLRRAALSQAKPGCIPSR